jgi:hypothetical protein
MQRPAFSEVLAAIAFAIGMAAMYYGAPLVAASCGFLVIVALFSRPNRGS